MSKLLPFIVVTALILGGLGFYGFVIYKPNIAASQLTEGFPVEVPKTLPKATIEGRIKSLEDLVTRLEKEINDLKSSISPAESASSSDSAPSSPTILSVESAVTSLKARVSALEKASTTAPATTTKYPLYIPLGGDAGPWNNSDWVTLTEYQVLINSDNYSGYSSMQLEVNARTVESLGVGMIRLYNVTDGTSVSSEVNITSTSFSVQSSDTFKLAGGQKKYSLQVKIADNKSLYIQSARIKVNF